ncbi:response regulator transcription factor [Hymenobacter sp. BT664]|uniref:Response regulator transcription factor n=1 Tax=Hymenobacter montanus TaxID=2771359 RepID=A0A927BES5_9BACT|nr:LytTR family DNA-binding domain-containing protein [Hymenobacter montanus]MBD2769507.1 response regulator transcription factor [Hymenobacter montanus]
MRVLIIEDEPLASEKLRDSLRRYNPAITVLAVLESAADAIGWLREHPSPDLIFSDIELLDGPVFRVFEEVSLTCPIIFATAYDQFVLRAFRENGIAYLLKPIEYPELSSALQKFERLRSSFAHLSPEAAQMLQTVLGQPTYKERFVVKARGGIYLLTTANIVCIELINEVAVAFDPKGNRHVLPETLSQLESVLNPRDFFRISRSEIISIHYLDKLENYGSDRLAVHLQGVSKVFISSASRTPGLRKWLG